MYYYHHKPSLPGPRAVTNPYRFINQGWKRVVTVRVRDLALLEISFVRVFHEHTTLAIMPILASEALLRKTKKIQ